MKIAPPQNSGHFNQQLVKLLMEMAHGEGSIPTLLQGVRFMRAERHIPRVPIAYEPEIVIIAQGRKTGYWGEKRIVYDPHHYLVMIFVFFQVVPNMETYQGLFACAHQRLCG